MVEGETSVLLFTFNQQQSFPQKTAVITISLLKSQVNIGLCNSFLYLIFMAKEGLHIIMKLKIIFLISQPKHMLWVLK